MYRPIIINVNTGHRWHDGDRYHHWNDRNHRDHDRDGRRDHDGHPPRDGHGNPMNGVEPRYPRAAKADADTPRRARPVDHASSQGDDRQPDQK